MRLDLELRAPQPYIRTITTVEHSGVIFYIIHPDIRQKFWMLLKTR